MKNGANILISRDNNYLTKCNSYQHHKANKFQRPKQINGRDKKFHIGESSLGQTVEFGGINIRSIKLDFPKFNGADCGEWIYKANQFFALYKTPDL